MEQNWELDTAICAWEFFWGEMESNYLIDHSESFYNAFFSLTQKYGFLVPLGSIAGLKASCTPVEIPGDDWMRLIWRYKIQEKRKAIFPSFLYSPVRGQELQKVLVARFPDECSFKPEKFHLMFGEPMIIRVTQNIDSSNRKFILVLKTDAFLESSFFLNTLRFNSFLMELKTLFKSFGSDRFLFDNWLESDDGNRLICEDGFTIGGKVKLLKDRE